MCVVYHCVCTCRYVYVCCVCQCECIVYLWYISLCVCVAICVDMCMHMHVCMDMCMCVCVNVWYVEHCARTCLDLFGVSSPGGQTHLGPDTRQMHHAGHQVSQGRMVGVAGLERQHEAPGPRSAHRSQPDTRPCYKAPSWGAILGNFSVSVMVVLPAWKRSRAGSDANPSLAAYNSRPLQCL